jgi:hypothetical protein
MKLDFTVSIIVLLLTDRSAIKSALNELLTTDYVLQKLFFILMKARVKY